MKVHESAREADLIGLDGVLRKMFSMIHAFFTNRSTALEPGTAETVPWIIMDLLNLLLGYVVLLTRRWSHGVGHLLSTFVWTR